MNLFILSFSPLDAYKLFLFSYIILLSLTPPKVIFVHNYYSFCNPRPVNLGSCLSQASQQLSPVGYRDLGSTTSQRKGRFFRTWWWPDTLEVYVWHGLSCLCVGKQICGVGGESISEEKQVRSAECVKANSQNCLGWKGPLGIM